MIAGAFDDGDGAAVADAEPLARHAADVGLAAGRAVERHVADDDVLFRRERRLRRRQHDELSAGQPFADIIVGVAFERERDPARHERAEALAGRSRETNPDRVVGEARAAPAAGQLGTEHRADRAIDVSDRPLD